MGREGGREGGLHVLVGLVLSVILRLSTYVNLCLED